MIMSGLTYGKNDLIADLSSRSLENNNLLQQPDFKINSNRQMDVQQKINEIGSDDIKKLFDNYQDLQAEQSAIESHFFYEQGFCDALNIALYVSQK